MYFIGIVYAVAYIFYMALGVGHVPLKKPYNKLFDNKTFLIHLSINLLITLIAVSRSLSGYYREIFFMAPLLFLVLLRLCNSLVRAITGRNVLFVARGDTRPTYYKWYVDGLVGVLIIVIPLCSCGYLMNYFRFGKFLK